MKSNLILSLLTLIISTSTLFSQDSFQMPLEDWELEINIDGFKIEKEGYSPDSTMFQLSATNGKTNISLSIFIEKTDSKGDKEECRKYYWTKAKNSPLAKENLNQYETDDLAIVEHDTKEFNGQVVDFHSLNAYLVQKGYWMDIHISKAGYTKKDKKLFKKIVESITIKSI